MRYISLDLGNFAIKSFDGVNPVSTIRSIRFALPQGVNALRYSNASPLLEIDMKESESGTGSFLTGQRIHFGTQVYHYRKQLATVTEDKTKLYKLLALAAIRPGAISTSNVSQQEVSLVISHPKPDSVRTELERDLLGVHTYKRNGVMMVTNVRALEVVPEGLGAYLQAKTEGAVPSAGYGLVIDIGGSTVITRLFTSKGELVAEDVKEKQGTYDLAQAIALDRRLTSQIDNVSSSLILDAFADGSLRYGDSAVSFAEYLDEYRKDWMRNILNTVKSTYAPYLPNIKRMIFTGGGAALVKPLLPNNPLFYVLENPSTANALGQYAVLVNTNQEVA